jgi:hypothetical protein
MQESPQGLPFRQVLQHAATWAGMLNNNWLCLTEKMVVNVSSGEGIATAVSTDGMLLGLEELMVSTSWLCSPAASGSIENKAKSMITRNVRISNFHSGHGVMILCAREEGESIVVDFKPTLASRLRKRGVDLDASRRRERGLYEAAICLGLHCRVKLVDYWDVTKCVESMRYKICSS